MFSGIVMVRMNSNIFRWISIFGW